MIRRLELHNFKGFERFTVTFGDDAYLVGPNNAGKSTIIAALRACAHMLRHAKRRQPTYYVPDRGHEVPAYAFGRGQFYLVEENLRHEFRQVEPRLELHFSNKAKLTAVWPLPEEPDEAPTNFFYLRTGEDRYIRRSADARAHFPDVAVLPLLSPVELQEHRLEDSTVRDGRYTRLASRHTRNHVRMLLERRSEVSGFETRFDEFLAWAGPWTPDFSLGDLEHRLTDRGTMLDLYCRETGSRTPKELFWAGDGIQVWIQLLMHLFRARDADTIVLDEPDLYLHADLQRRLVRLLDGMTSQTVAASHSAEVLVEASPSSVVWISKDRRRGVRAPDEAVLADLSAAIGSQFNLRLARALKAQAVIFVEGDDMRVLRNIAKKLNARCLVEERGLVTVPLKGFSNWEHVEPFSWLVSELLEHAVKVLTVLDRDYRTADQVRSVHGRLAQVGVECHVWRRKELESYLLDARTIARVSGAPVDDVATKLIALADELRQAVSARLQAERLQTEVTAKQHEVNVMEAHARDFEQMWADPEARPHRCNAKDMLHGLNGWLREGNFRPVSSRSLSNAMLKSEVPDEMADLIVRAEQMLA